MRRFQRQGRLADPNVVQQFGFLFYGFDERTSWWEAVVMLRKLAAIGTTVWLIGGDENTVSLQLTVLTGIFVGSMLLQARLPGRKTAVGFPACLLLAAP